MIKKNPHLRKITIHRRISLTANSTKASVKYSSWFFQRNKSDQAASLNPTVPVFPTMAKGRFMRLPLLERRLMASLSLMPGSFSFMFIDL